MARLIKLGLMGLLLTTSLVGVTSKPVHAMERVQLSVFLVNIVEAGRKKTGQMPITIYLDLKDRDEADYVCGIAPRIRDSIFQHLNKEVFYLDTKNKFDVKKLRLDLWPIAYKAIPNVKLQNMLVVQGEGKVSSSEARLFSRRGCRIVLDDEG